MRNWRIAFLISIVLLTLTAATPALAFNGGGPGDKVVVGEDFTLGSGETVDGDLVVFGGDVDLEADSQVDGDVVVWGGDVEVAGMVNGDVVVFGGSVHLASTAVVYGEAVVMGGLVEQDDGAEVQGSEVTGPAGMSWRWYGPAVMPFVHHGTTEMTPGHIALAMLWRAARLLLTVLLMAVLAGLVAVLWPGAAQRVGRAGVQSVLPAMGLGLLTVVVVAALLLSICLSVLGVVAVVVVGVAAVFGWVSIGIVIGERLLAGRQVHPFWSAALGAGLLTLVSSLLGLIPCVGWAGGFLVMCVALGSALLTHLGRVEYPL